MEKTINHRTEHCADEIFGNNVVLDLSLGKQHCKVNKLSSTLKHFVNTEDYPLPTIQINEELADKKTRVLICKLAQAIDNNDIARVKEIKSRYGDTEEFANAKEFLNDKCKEIWNVFEHKKIKLNLPIEAMKILGITNQPSLKFLLYESIRYFERTNGNTTVTIISAILSNPNINYTFDDIFKYLVQENYGFNQNTIKYLLLNIDFVNQQPESLGLTTKQLKRAFSSLSFKEKYQVITKIAKKYFL